MINWKTTLGGILAALGQFLETITDPAWIGLIGRIISAVGVFLIGATARDFNVTSEQSGAK
jgi:hypothetical protein